MSEKLHLQSLINMIVFKKDLNKDDTNSQLTLKEEISWGFNLDKEL